VFPAPPFTLVGALLVPFDVVQTPKAADAKPAEGK
jgi:hypothetical protein